MDKETMRIAMIGHKRIPSREGGVEVVVEELASRMAKAGHRITCYNRKGHHVSGSEFDGRRMLEYKGIRLKTVFAIDKKGLAALTASYAAALRAAFGKYDVVHFHAEGPCAALWLPKLLGKRCVATIHGLDHQRAKWNRFAKAYLLFGEMCAVRYADEIIVLSEGVRQYFLKKHHRETCFLPNGVNEASYHPAELIRAYGLEKGNYVLFLGRLVPEKGLCYLIEAYRNVKTDKNLVIAGGSSDTDQFAANIKRMAEGDKRIVFTGFVQGQILEELYSNAYIYVLPSDLEGMPLTLLEAMSYGNCCLVSDIAECAEVVDDKAVLFRKGDVADLQKKIQMLCDDIELVQGYKDTAAEYVCKKYSWDRVVDKTLELYQTGRMGKKG